MSEIITQKAIAFVAAHERIRPLRDGIVIEPTPTAFSKILEVVVSGRPMIQGTVRAVGPGKYPNRHARGEKDGKPYHTISPSKRYIPTSLKPGDKVYLGAYDFPAVNWGGIDMIMATEADVGIVE